MTSSGSATSGGQIALQILAPPTAGGHRHAGGNSAGGFFGEWSQKFTALGCVATFTALMVGAALATSIGALWYVYRDDAATECIGEFAGISFSYVTWLRVLGLSFCGSLFLEIILVFAHGWSGTMCTSKAATAWGLIMYLFQAAWYAVGAILYWKTVADNCEKGSEIQTFSFALFIIQSTVVLCLICGRKAAEAAV
jgi:hypothetical protein